MNTAEVSAVESITKGVPGRIKYKQPKPAKKEKGTKPAKAAKSKTVKPEKTETVKEPKPKSIGLSDTSSMPSTNLGGLGNKPRQFKGK
jgi:hypothetical protein